MGYGDKLMAIGRAWQLHRSDPHLRRIAIGDGKRIDPTHQDLTWGLDFLASQRDLDDGDEVDWVISHGHHHGYHDHQAMRAAVRRSWWLRYFGFLKSGSDLGKLGHYIYNFDYRASPAPIRLTPEEAQIADDWSRESFVIIEPFIKPQAPPSKQWPVERYLEVARRLGPDVQVYQMSAPQAPSVSGLKRIQPHSFRQSMAYLKAARLYIGPEGGLHHAAAAMGTRAVIVFGGFTPPEITGYDFHINLTGGSERACGTHRGICPHCAQAMANITVDDVERHARHLLAQVAMAPVSTAD